MITTHRTWSNPIQLNPKIVEWLIYRQAQHREQSLNVCPRERHRTEARQTTSGQMQSPCVRLRRGPVASTNWFVGSVDSNSLLPRPLNCGGTDWHFSDTEIVKHVWRYESNWNKTLLFTCKHIFMIFSPVQL